MFTYFALVINMVLRELSLLSLNNVSNNIALLIKTLLLIFML